MQKWIARSVMMVLVVAGLTACGGGAQSVRRDSAAQTDPAQLANTLSRWQTASLGGFGEVHLYVPTSMSPIGQGRSLTVLLHGCMQPTTSFLRANLEKAAEAYGMIFAVPEAKYKNEFGCWVFWKDSVRDGANDYHHLLSLVSDLTSQSGLKVDPAQVYLTGISSGGAFAMQMGCMAPEVFSGMGIYAAPSAGTNETQALQSSKAGTPEEVAATCRGLAGANQSAFATQIMNAATGVLDNVANPDYAPQNAKAMAIVYGVAPLQGETRISGGTGAIETRWQDNRVTLLMLQGIGHDWSGGAGAAGAYITGSGVNYAHYLARFFTENNKRVKR